MGQKIEGGVVDVEHPSIVQGVNNMLRQGYSNGEICRLIGVPNEVADHHRRIFEKGSSSSSSERKYTESELLEMLAKMRADRKHKRGRPRKTEEIVTETAEGYKDEK